MADIPQQEPAPDAGGDCTDCNGILWAAGKTPSKVLVVFRDLIQCPSSPTPPNNTVFTLDQVPASPCLWETVQTSQLAPWAVGWNAETGFLFARHDVLGGKFAFQATFGPCAWQFWTNDRQCFNSAASGGSAFVIPVNNALCQVLAQLYGLNPNSPAFYQQLGRGFDHTLFHLGIRTDKTNCNIYVDDEFLDFPWDLS